MGALRNAIKRDDGRVPVTVITGFLGSGKVRLHRHFPGRRLPATPQRIDCAAAAATPALR